LVTGVRNVTIVTDSATVYWHSNCHLIKNGAGAFLMDHFVRIEKQPDAKVALIEWITIYLLVADSLRPSTRTERFDD
jgi:hypothetical protein